MTGGVGRPTSCSLPSLKTRTTPGDHSHGDLREMMWAEQSLGVSGALPSSGPNHACPLALQQIILLIIMEQSAGRKDKVSQEGTSKAEPSGGGDLVTKSCPILVTP